MRRIRKSALSIVFLWTTLALTLLGPASASANHEPGVFHPGEACDFGPNDQGLKFEQLGGNQISKEFTDNDGTLRILWAGKGTENTFTNVATGETFVQKAAGSVTRVTYYPDGSSSWVFTGSVALFLFPNDVPAGPSTTLVAGRVVVTTANGLFTVTEISGKTTDICAELST